MNAPLDIAPLIVWAAGITTLLNLANMLWTIFSGPSRKLGVLVEDAKVRIGQLEHDLHRLRDRLDQMPNTGALHQLELSLARMEGNLKILNERMTPIAAIADKMQELMLHGKG